MPQCATTQGKVFYEVSGKGDPLVLLHADGSSGLEFAPVIDSLEGTWQVVVIDLPGCGRSPRRAFSIEYYEENAKAALDVLKKVTREPAAVVGVGGGGICGLWMNILAPRKIRAVVGDSFAEFYDPEDATRDLAAHQQPTEEMIAFWRDMNGQDWKTVIHELDRLFAQMAEDKHSVFDWRLDDVRCPVLLCASRKDHLVKDAGSRMFEVAAQIGSAQLILYPEGDHPSMWSNASAFWRDARAFLNGICGHP